MNDPSLLCAVGNSGGAFPIEHNGKTYKLHNWTDALRARYLQWAKSYAMRTLRELQRAGIFTPSEYQLAFDGLRRDLVNGEYEFGKSAIASLTGTETGFHILVRVLLNDESVSDDEIKDLIEKRYKELFAIIESFSPAPSDDDLGEQVDESKK